MPELELHDLTNDQTFAVPAEGLVFGREGGDADVQLTDNTISRRQARISYKGGSWLYETMAVAQGKPVPRPRPLAQGETFHIGRTEFEVLNVVDEAPPPAPPAAKGAKKAGPSQRQLQGKTVAAAPVGDAPPAKGLGALLVAVPKGLAYSLVNVPKLLFNPFGTVATAIERQPAEPMGKVELIGYALPALLATALLGSIATGLALLIGPGHVFSLGAFLPVMPAVIAVVFAVVVGFVFHPVLEWVLRKLFQGTSDARTRTNFFLQTITLSVLLAVPGALGTVLASLPVPFLGLLGPLLSTLAALVTLYVTYQWCTKVFQVAKWARTLLVVLGALLVALAAVGLVTGLIGDLRRLGSGSSPTATAEAAVAEAEPAAEAARPEAEGAGEAAKPKKPAAEAGAKGAKGAERPPEAKAEDPKAEAKREPETAPEPPPAPRVADPAPAVAASGPYAAWARKREAVEKTLEADPTRLEASKELQDLYGQYLADCAEVEKKAAKDLAKHKDKVRLYERLRDAELFHRTGATVDELAKKLGVR